jgi:enoyl-[acyl-carrier-protein] reductase (NADH)
MKMTGGYALVSGVQPDESISDGLCTHASVQHASPFFGFGSYQNDEMAEKYRTIASKARGIDASVTNDVSPEGNINKQTMTQCKFRKRIKKTGSTVKTKRTNEPQ